MKSIFKKLFQVLPLLFFSVIYPHCVSASGIEMADLMRSNGMIYVVVTVLCIIFSGILVYLFLIERRLKKLEKEKR